jgi:anti-anti-sigma factor
MEIKVELDSNIIFLKMSGSLVAAIVDELKTQVQKLIEKRYVHIVFDLSNVDFIDSSGLGLCIATSRELAAVSGKLVCYGLRENVQKLFSMTKADQKIAVMASRTNAFDYMLAKMNGETSDAT